MEMGGPPRPRVSRETRLLLITVLISIVTLWVLARVRFPERPVTPNPVPPLLAQLPARPTFEDLALAVAELELRLAPSLLALDLEQRPPTGDQPTVAQDVIPALRIRDDVSVALLGTTTGVARAPRAANLTVLARDPSGLAVIRVPAAPAPVLTVWSPQRRRPRYMIVSDVSRQGMSLRPVFVGSLYAAVSPMWSASIWAVPAHTELATGAFVFTTDGALAGLVIEHEGRLAILPGEALIGAADRLLREGSRGSGWIGVEVQALTPAVALVAGASGGVMVTWVDPRGPAADKLVVTDVIEAIADEGEVTLEHWEARLSRLAAGESLVLRVRRRGEVREIQLTAGGAPPTPSEAPPLGLTMRAVPRIGVEVVRVDPGSAAARAGIEAGDVMTLIGEVETPTPDQVTQAFLATPEDRPLLVGVTRGDRHRVLALGKR